MCIPLAETCWRLGEETQYRLAIASLTATQQSALIAAKTTLARACASRTMSILVSVPSDRCSRFNVCQAVRESSLNDLGDSDTFGSTFADTDALNPLHERLWGGHDWFRLCGHCRTASANADKRRRKELWLQLPLYFGLKMGEGDWPTTLDAVRL